MARQPFLSQKRATRYLIGTDTLEKLPELARHLSNITFLWSHVELHLALAMGALLGVENAGSVAVFTALRNNRSRREALLAAAKVSLSADDLMMFQAIMNIHASLDGERNDVVHGIWGYTDELTDAALWHSLQAHATALIRDYHAIRADRQDPNFDRIENIKRELFVYPLADLQTLAGNINQLQAALLRFHGYLRIPQLPAGQNARRELSELPIVHAELERLNKQAESKKAGQDGSEASGIQPGD